MIKWLRTLSSRLERIESHLFKLDKLEQIEARLSGLEKENSSSCRLIETLDELSLVEKSNAILSRVEVVRDEILYELRVANSNFNDTKREDIPVEYVTPEKFKNSTLKLNLGCGHIPIEEYINVDARKIAGVDLVSDVTRLPFTTDSIDEIYSAHLVEHFTELQLREEILPHWKSIMKPGAKMVVIVPDAEAMSRAYLEGSMPFGDYKLVTFGAQDYTGDFHYTMFSPDSLCSMLSELGFKNINVIESGRINGLCREMEVECEK
ncbi:hypothetical protein AB4486_19570 [Vibrio sp. 10N.222.55.C6]|uniref:class I SAM-dependent methyltransferase n=1 Tax=Vibrio sp. 10N.222.55.C6 TaxID=3229649 RepID=UPI003550B431